MISAPTLSMVDNGDGTVTGTVTGDETIMLWYRLTTETEWGYGGFSVGDGTIDVVGLTAGKAYQFYAYSTDTVTNSAPSNVITLFVAGSTANVESAIYAVLSADATVASLVSTRIYPQLVPQNTSLPAVVYTQISGVRTHTMATANNIVESRWQFTCISTTYTALQAIADSVRDALDDYSGTASGITIQNIHCIEEIDGFDISAGNDSLRRYTKIIECYIWFNE